MDAQGPERARPYVETAGVTFPAAVDEENVLGGLFGFKAVPNVVFLDEQGVVRYAKFGGFDVRKPEHEKLVRVFAEGGGPETDEDPGATFEHPEALEGFRAGLEHYRTGDVEGAVAAWRDAASMEPDNWVIRKQLWAVEHPERFYSGDVDFEWQFEQMAED